MKVKLQIINSLFDNDFYKFTMMSLVLHQFPGAMVKYRFYSRGQQKLGFLKDEIETEIRHLCSLKFRQDELDYFSGIPYFKRDFIEFLRIFNLNEDFVKVENCQGELKIEIEGPWLHTILFEVPILAIVSELYFKDQKREDRFPEASARLEEKIRLIKSKEELKGFYFADFGTRRRFSYLWQDEVIRRLSEELPDNFVGTSNVRLAQIHNLKVMGTHAHEIFQASQALGPRLVDSQKFALQAWVNEYRGDLGIALTDTIGMDPFLRDFDKYFSKLYDGCRHDSGDAFEWTEKLISHYQALRIDPHTKTAVYSNGLNFPDAISIYKAFKDRIKISFGIGTNLTNDTGVEPLNIVIKMSECNGQQVAKVSDDSGKNSYADPSYLAYLRSVFGI